MIGQIATVNFKDIRIAAPAFLAIVMMPLTYSIANGIGIGVIASIVISIMCWLVEGGRRRKSANASGYNTIENTKVYDNFATSNELADGEEYEYNANGNESVVVSHDTIEGSSESNTKFPSMTAIVIGILFLAYFIFG